MNADEILKKASAVGELLSLNHKDTADPDHYEDLLPHFIHMQQISNCHKEGCFLKSVEIIRKISKLQEELEKLQGVSKSSVNIAASLKYIVDSSHMTVHLVNRAKRNGTIPLPHQHHNHIIQIIKNCMQIITDIAKRKDHASSVDWAMISSVLKSTTEMYENLAEVLDSNIQEHQWLRVNTIKLLEQMSKLDFH